MKRYRIKRVGHKWVLHTQRKVNGRKAWRRLCGYSFVTESQARTFAEGTF